MGPSRDFVDATKFLNRALYCAENIFRGSKVYSDHDKRKDLAMSNDRMKRIHVSQPNIRFNLKAKPEAHVPPITIQTSAGPLYGWDVTVHGASRLIWGDKPLSCGARVWLETTAPVTIQEKRQEQKD